jgi:hypothetical protein
VKITKVWNNGDVVTVRLPFKTEVEVINSGRNRSGGITNSNNQDIGVRRGPLYFSLRLNAQWGTFETYSEPFGSIGWTHTVDAWNYALRMDPANGNQYFQVFEAPMPSEYIWGARGTPVWNPATGAHLPLGDNVPVYLTAKAKRVASWSNPLLNADTPPQSPVADLAAVEEVTVELIPYGTAHARISVMPWYEGPGWVTVGCLDPLFREYDPLAGAHDPAACIDPVPVKEIHPGQEDIIINKSLLTVTIQASGAHVLAVRNLAGELVRTVNGTGHGTYRMREFTQGPGVYFLQVHTAGGTITEKMIVM